MECKNCENTLRTDYSFCPDCGAKVIRNRITVKNLWYDAFERFFNVDNTFLKTFLHLFTKPEEVIEGYIIGVRRKYLNPISYITIALTLSSFTLFLMKRAKDNINMDIFNSGANAEGMAKIQELTLEYNSLLFLSFIPFMATASWLVFENKKFNYSERVVTFMYILGHYSISIFLPTITLLILSPESYMSIGSLLGFAIILLYCSWAIYRISRLNIGSLFGHLFLFFFIFFAFLFVLSGIILPILLILTGAIDVNDFVPKPV